MINLERNIRRRKRGDAIFAILGIVLIFGSLSILGILIGGLVRDGGSRLLQTQEAKEDGGTPGKREILGTLRYAVDGKTLEIVPDPAELIIPSDSSVDLALLAGKRIAIEGSPPKAGENVIEVESAAPVVEGKRIGRRSLTGILTKVGDAANARWSFAPDVLQLDLSEAQPGMVSATAGDRAAVLPRSKAGTMIVVEAASKLVPKGFFTSFSSSNPYRAGIFPAIIGTILVMIVTMCTALPLGVGAGIYLEEYASKNWFTTIIEINIANLAGVPSIIWGLMSFAIFVTLFQLKGSVATAGLTLGLLVLPIVIISTREAIRSVPRSIRDASIALGATKWQTVRHHVLPYSLSGILTGAIVGLSRAVGETAPLIVVGAVVSINYLPDSPVTGNFPFLSFAWLKSGYTVLPIQMFHWTSSPYAGFNKNAAAAGIVLIALTLSMNAVAIYLRYRLRSRYKW